MEAAKEQVKFFILRFLRVSDLPEDQDIFAEGYVNSLFALQLITFVERTFGVTVEDQDLEIDNFRSVAAIVRFVEGKCARADGAASPAQSL